MTCNSRTRKVVHGCAVANTNSYFIVFEVIVKLCVDGLRGVRRAFVGVSAVRAGRGRGGAGERKAFPVTALFHITRDPAVATDKVLP